MLTFLKDLTASTMIIIFLSKLRFYVLRDDALSLLKNYLTSRDQYVQLCNIKSECHAILCGILQGSVMGPLLFNIVMNDLKSATSKFDLLMYADDTTLVSTLENFTDRNNANEIEQNINKEIYKITT